MAKYIISKFGGKKLSHNGHLYNFHSQSPSSTLYQCFNYKKNIIVLFAVSFMQCAITFQSIFLYFYYITYVTLCSQWRMKVTSGEWKCRIIEWFQWVMSESVDLLNNFNFLLYLSSYAKLSQEIYTIRKSKVFCI